jgi:hypothetical protein
LAHRICLFIIVIMVATTSRSQTSRRPVAASYIGLGAYSISHIDVFSFVSNQASLAQLQNASASIYSEKRFLLSEVSYYGLAFALPTPSGNFGINAGYFGFSDYNESQIGLAYARKLGSKVDIGVQFDYNSIQIAGYGNATAVNFQIGAVMHLSDKLHAGVHIYNPVGGKFGKDRQEKLASAYKAGMGYEASDKFFVSAEIQKTENLPVNVLAGMQYKFLPQLMARVGINTETSVAYMGLGLQLKSFRIDVTASRHPQLGVSPGLLLLYNFKTKQTAEPE